MLKNLKVNHLVNSVLQSDIGIFQIRRRLVNLYKISIEKLSILEPKVKWLVQAISSTELLVQSNSAEVAKLYLSTTL